MAGRADRLTAMQERFVQEYLKDPGNASTAYRRAGYKATTPASVGACASQLLKLPKVAAAVAEGQRAMKERAQLSADELLAEVDVVAYSCLDNYVVRDDGRLGVVDGAPPRAMGAVASVEYIITTSQDGTVTRRAKIRLWDKVAAQRLALQRRGLLVERHEHEMVKPVEVVVFGDAKPRQEGG